LVATPAARQNVTVAQETTENNPATWIGELHDRPVNVVASPRASTATQKCAEAHETDWRLPKYLFATIRFAGDHDRPLYVIARLPMATAAQKRGDGQETETRRACASAVREDHERPSYTTAWPRWSTATQKLGDAHEIHEWSPPAVVSTPASIVRGLLHECPL
jgi:hypothetical protein